MRELEPGEPRRLGDHELVGVLGTGGFGRVYVARAPHDKWLTVKLAHPHLLRADGRFVERFEEVMGDLSRVRNLGAGRIVQWDAEDVRPWYARRFVPGASLTELLATCGALPRAAGRIVGGVARGLAAMHAVELPHGGVSPGNVLVSVTSAQLVDGGLIRLFDRGTPESRGRLPLTGRAFAPSDDEPETMAADLYALGVLLVLCARGTLPSGPGDVAELPEDLAALAQALMDPVPLARPRAAEVAAWLGGQGGERGVVAGIHVRGRLVLPDRERIGEQARQLGSLLPRAARDVIAWHARSADHAGLGGLAGLPAQMADAVSAAVASGGPGRALVPGARRGAESLATQASSRPPTAASATGNATGGQPQAPAATGSGTGVVAAPEDIAPAEVADSAPVVASSQGTRAAELPARSLWTHRIPGVQNLFAADGMLFADGDSLTALDAQTGDLVWSKPGWRMAGEPRDGQAYLAQGTRIALVDAASGTEVWRTDIAAARGLWARSAGRLARAERSFRVHAVYRPVPGAVTAIGGHSELFGLDPVTGNLLWNRREARRTAFSRDGAGAVFLSGDGREPVHALDAATGEPLWRDDAEDSIVTTVDRDLVLCARFRKGTAEIGEYVVRVARSGELLYSDPNPGEMALLDDGTLYILGGGRLRAASPALGKALWDVEWAGGSAGIAFAPAGNVAFLRGEDRRVYAVDIVNGRRRWVSDPIPARPPLDPVGGQLDRTLPVLAAGDVVCVRSHSDAVLIVLDREDGRERWWWRAAFGTLTMVAPVVVGQFVYVVDGDRVRALTARQT